MGCKLNKETIDATIAFHGHTCPGLAIGIRVAELAIEQLDINQSTAPVCMVETDMCAVDAIQFLTGCTFGKGNLIHKDYGKSGFTFFDRNAGKGIRVVFKDERRPKNTDENDVGTLMQKMADGTATDAEKQQAADLRAARIEDIMGAKLDDLFSIQKIAVPPVRPARILESIQCQSCHEMTMESRIRRFDGKDLCIPCFMEKEQKI